jgi:uncharacterized protein (TIGR03435 family)
MHPSPGRLSANGQTVKRLASLAYELDETQVVGGPSWVDGSRFDIVAVWQQSGERIVWADERQRMQTLLADRFQLVTHREKRELTVFALVAGKKGRSSLRRSRSRMEPAI